MYLLIRFDYGSFTNVLHLKIIVDTVELRQGGGGGGGVSLGHLYNKVTPTYPYSWHLLLPII